MKRTKFFYGWIVVLSCTLLAFSINAMGNNTLSFYVTSISETFHVNRATTNFMFFTTGLITRTLLGLFFGRLAVRFGVKRLMIAATFFVLAGFMAYTYADGIWMIGLGSALYGIAHAIGTLSSYNVIINNWFTKNKGLMLAVINTAVGFGGMLINPLVSMWIERYGWNQSFFYTAILMAAIAIPSLAFIREKPRAGEMEAAQMPAAPPPRTGSKVTLRQTFRTTRFWLLVAVQLLTGFAVGPSFTNAIPALRALGVNPALISSVLSLLIALGIVIGHVSTGLLFDRFGLKSLMNTAVGIVAVGLVLMGFLTGSSSVALLVFTVLCIGYSNALQLGTLSHMINNVFAAEQKDFTALFGFLFAVQNIGIMIGSPVSGMIYDHTGSYRIAYWLSAGLVVLMLALLRIALRLAHRSAEKTVTGG